LDLETLLLEKLYLWSIGATVFLGLLHYAGRAQVFRWQVLAAHYAVPGRVEVGARKRLQTVILLGGGSRFAYTAYPGLVTVALSDDFLRLRLLFPWSIYHAPLSIPFAELQAGQTHWFLNSDSFELRAAKAHDVKIVITGELLDWIATTSPGWKIDTARRW
jgi:hypothetical protein